MRPYRCSRITFQAGLVDVERALEMHIQQWLEPILVVTT